MEDIKTKEEFINFCKENNLEICTAPMGTLSYGTCCKKKYKIKKRSVMGTFENLDYIDFIETYIEYDGKEYILYNNIYYKIFYKNDPNNIGTFFAYNTKDKHKNNVHEFGINKNIDKIVIKKGLI